MKKIFLVIFIILIVAVSIFLLYFFLRDTNKSNPEVKKNEITVTNYDKKIIIEDKEFNLISEEELAEKIKKCREEKSVEECHKEIEDYLEKEKEKYKRFVAREKFEKEIIDYFSTEFSLEKIDFAKTVSEPKEIITDDKIFQIVINGEEYNIISWTDLSKKYNKCRIQNNAEYCLEEINNYLAKEKEKYQLLDNKKI